MKNTSGVLNRSVTCALNMAVYSVVLHSRMENSEIWCTHYPHVFLKCCQWLITTPGGVLNLFLVVLEY